MNHQEHHHTHKNKAFKSGIILIGVAVVLMGIVGFSYFNNTSTKNINTFGTANFAGGGGCSMMRNNRISATPVTPTTVTATNSETINVEYSDNEITPSVINLQQGKKYKIVMTMNHDPRGCMSTILLRGLDERVQPVQRGMTLTFNVDATTPGTYGFVCGAMGMSHGANVVIQ